MGQQRRHAVVAQAPGVDGIGHEVVAQGVHLHQRGQPGRVAEVVGVDAVGERRARRRLDRPDGRVHRAGQLLAQEGEGQPPEVRPAAGAPDDQVGRASPGLAQLQEGLLADDRLVQEHVVEHAAQRVAHLGVLGRHLDGLGDGDAQRAGVVLVDGQVGPAALGQRRGRAVHDAAEGLHHHAPVRLLVVAGPDLPHLALQAEQGAGEGQGGAPLPGAGLGGQLLHPGLGVVVGLGHGGVGLVAAGRADALVLVVDAGRRPERRPPAGGPGTGATAATGGTRRARRPGSRCSDPSRPPGG